LVDFIVWLNSVFRKPRVGGRESPAAYSEWEFRWGQSLVGEYLGPAGDLAGKRVLDIGCGLGGKTVAYGEAGAAEIIGADCSADHVAAAERFARGSERTFRWGFVVGDAAGLPFADETFDTVIANDAMEHFPEPDAALGEMVRVTKRGGAIWLFFTPHFSPLGSHLYDYVHTPWCHLLFRRRDLEGAIREVVRSGAPGWSAEEVDGKVASIMKSYDTELNHMTIGEFRRMVSKSPELVVAHEELKPAKFSSLGFLTKVPFVQELFTGTVIYRLERAVS
jgi:ubiquinone/menaquinone biosynthesis C-methylase UbiE